MPTAVQSVGETMFIAHIGVGLAPKRVARRVPLGVLLVAGQALDILCGVLLPWGNWIDRHRQVESRAGAETAAAS
jgi:hypothetical protein